MKLSAFRLFISILMLTGTSVPVAVLGQSSPREESRQFMETVKDQLIFRNEVERDSLNYTRNLCEVFRLRKKYGMGMYPNPAAETWTKMVDFQPGESWAYTKSLGYWADIGNEGILTNWGLKSSPGEKESLIKLKRSLFTRTLVSTDGFKIAAQDCGYLDAKSLRQALFEQERMQTVVTYAALFGVAVRFVVKGAQMTWSAVRLTLVGRTLARAPWTGVKRAAIGGLIAYALFEGAREYLALGDQESGDSSVEESLQTVMDQNIQEMLKIWLKNMDTKNAKYHEAQAYLDQHKTRVAELQKFYQAWLEQFGEQKIDQTVAKYTSGADLTGDERQIFLNAVLFSAANLYLGQH